MRSLGKGEREARYGEVINDDRRLYRDGCSLCGSRLLEIDEKAEATTNEESNEVRYYIR